MGEDLYLQKEDKELREGKTGVFGGFEVGN